MRKAKTADEHFNYWTGFLDKAPFLDGIIINEFIVNKPSTRAVRNRQPRASKADGTRAASSTRCMKRPFKRMRADDATRTRCSMPTSAAAEKAEPGDHRPDVRPHPHRLRLSHRPRTLHFRSLERAEIQRRLATIRRRDCRLGSQGARRQRADGHCVRPVLDAARRHQQAAQRRLSRLDGPADEHRGQSSVDGGHWRV